MTNEPKAGQGLDPEMLAAYMDNRLPPEQRATVEAQLANDPDSHAVLVETMKALDDGDVPQVRTVSASAAEGRFGETTPKLAGPLDASEGGPGVPKGEVPTVPIVPGVPGSQAAILPMPARGLKTRWVFAGSVLAAAAALAMVVWLQPEMWQRIRGGEPVDPLMAKLVDAVGEERYIEARLTGGFKYGPLRSVTRGPGDASQQNLALLAAAGELQKKAAEEPSAANLRAAGTSQLILGNDDEAVALLEQAAVMAPDDARLQTDLSAGYLARADRRGRVGDLPLALAAAERAIAADGSVLEARFNRALALQRLERGGEARAAWRDYADRDGSVWGEDARRRGGSQ